MNELELHGIKLGLENIRYLLDAIGNPHERYPAIHVAGTNGKGSTLAILDAIMQEAGIKTGRNTSPHLIELNERFLVNSEPISDARIETALNRLRPVAEAMDPPPTYFEVVTAMAFDQFADSEIDLGLIEVGMGGRFDATNAIAPIACGITNIELDHAKYLGDTLEQIAFEKAGILKPGIPAVVSETRAAPLEVILDRAARAGAPVLLRDRDFQFHVGGPPFEQVFSYEGPRLRIGPAPLPLAGAYQGENAATAVALAELAGEHFQSLTARSIETGIQQARWPCRLERVLDDPPVIIDVAHNAGGARRLAEAIPRSIVLLAVSSDKDARAMIDALAPMAERLVLTQFENPRAMPLDELCAAAGNRFFIRCRSLEGALAAGLEAASKELPLLITGSIFTAGEARRILIESRGARPLRF